MTARLQIVSGPLSGQTFELSDEVSFIIGRDEEADLTLDDVKVSRWHATIQRRSEGLVLTDFASKNGSFVNEEPIANALLRSGDTIRVGDTEMELVELEPAEAQPSSDLPEAAGGGATAAPIPSAPTPAVRPCDGCGSGITVAMVEEGVACRIGSSVLCPDCLEKAKREGALEFADGESSRRALKAADPPRGPGEQTAQDLRAAGSSAANAQRSVEETHTDIGRKKRTRRLSRRKRF